jgi:RNA polymerase sigma-70 factor (ECF subfamily)
MTEVDLQALRRGDEQAYRTLVQECHSTMLRLALMYSPSRAIAEETVQETWLAVLGGLDGFAGRASLRTWICRILVRIARRRAGLEARSMPFSTMSDADSAAFSPDTFVKSGPRAGRWEFVAVPQSWSHVPEDKVLSRELHDVVSKAIAELPQGQREVIALRDVDGWSSAEVSDLLDITDGHQRVLLHRARCRVRSALDLYLTSPPAAAA